MFCKRCGAEILENTKFCAKCGTPVENAAGAQRVSGVVSSPAFVPNAANPVVPGSATKKTLKTLKWVGALLFAVVFIVVVVLANKWAEKKDFVGAVKECKPFADQGLEYTYEEVLGRYISNATWFSNEVDKKAYVMISGRTVGYDANIAVTITVTRESKLSDVGIIEPEKIEVDDEETSDENEVVNFLLILFQSYDEGYKDFSEILESIDLSEDEDEKETQSEQPKPSLEGNHLGDKISINEAQYFEDNVCGNFETTLNYIEFTDEYTDSWDSVIYPDAGCIFVIANFTTKNLGNEPDFFPIGSFDLIYDGAYKYDNTVILNGLSSVLAPLTAPVTGSIVYMVPVEVMESGKSISLVYEHSQMVHSYDVRPNGGQKRSVDSGEKVVSKESAEPQESVDSGKYASVEEFLQDPIIASQLQEMMSDLDDMQLELSGDGDTLVYTFTFTEDIDAEYVAKEMLKEMNDPEFASTFEDIAGSLSEAIEVTNPSVIVAYRNVDGSLICSQEYFPN